MGCPLEARGCCLQGGSPHSQAALHGHPGAPPRACSEVRTEGFPAPAHALGLCAWRVMQHLWAFMSSHINGTFQMDQGRNPSLQRAPRHRARRNQQRASQLQNCRQTTQTSTM